MRVQQPDTAVWLEVGGGAGYWGRGMETVLGSGPWSGSGEERSHATPCARSQGPVLRARALRSHLRILYDFIFELGFAGEVE